MSLDEETRETPIEADNQAPVVRTFDRLLLPASGQNSDSPECFSVFGYVVPCGLGSDQPHGVGFAAAGSVVAAALVLVGSAVGRRHRDQ